MLLLSHFLPVCIFLRNDKHLSNVRHPQNQMGTMKLGSTRFSVTILETKLQINTDGTNYCMGCCHRKCFLLCKFMNLTPVSGIVTPITICRLGCSRHFWNGYLFSVRILDHLHPARLTDCSGTLPQIQNIRICVFSVMGTAAWQTHSIIVLCTQIVTWSLWAPQIGVWTHLLLAGRY